MEFALGYTAGIATCVFLAAILTYFKRPIITMLANAETKIANAGPRPRGFVIEPISEAEDARAARIQENKERGADTRISELQ